MIVAAEINELNSRVTELERIVSMQNTTSSRMLTVLESLLSTASGNTDAIEGIHQQLALLKPPPITPEET